MDVTARELRDSELSESFRGYSKEEVNDLLDRAAATLEALEVRIRQLSTAPPRAAADTSAPVTPDPSVSADAAARTLALAQRVADETVAEAQTRASEIVGNAETQGQQLIAEAEGELRRIEQVERVRIETEIAELEARRLSLDGAIDDLAGFETDYRERLIASIRSALAAAEAKTSVVTTPRPSVPAPIPESPSDVTHSTAMIETTGEAVLENAAFPAESSIDPLIESSADDAPADEPTTAPTIDLAEEQAAERSGLADEDATADDSDDFFASLREATSENTALSPTEERLFDTDDDRDPSFRDVFRRRR